MDSNGDWYWYEDKPKYSQFGAWSFTKGKAAIAVSCSDQANQSLQQRPNGEPTQTEARTLERPNQAESPTK